MLRKSEMKSYPGNLSSFFHIFNALVGLISVSALFGSINPLKMMLEGKGVVSLCSGEDSFPLQMEHKSAKKSNWLFCDCTGNVRWCTSLNLGLLNCWLVLKRKSFLPPAQSTWREEKKREEAQSKVAEQRVMKNNLVTCLRCS